MRTKQLLNAANSAATSDAWCPNVFEDSPREGMVQVQITGTATVVVEGCLSVGAPWVVLATFTASGISWVALTPQMRVRVSAYTSGTVSAWVGA